MPDRTTQSWIVSPSVVVSWRAERIEIAAASSGDVVRTENADVLRLINAFARPMRMADVVDEFRAYPRTQTAACIDELIDAGILIACAAFNPIVGHGWDAGALAFHRRSRRSASQVKPAFDVAGAVGPATTIPLDHPARGKVRDLWDMLESRRSVRSWPHQVIARDTLSSLFWLSARNRKSPGAAGDGDVRRPYPSGGAIYSLEIYPVIAPGAVESIHAGVYRYRPEHHALEALSEEPGMYVPFLEAAGRSAGSDPPPIVLLITSRIARQNAVYGDLAYSLVLKEVGAVFQTLYLVAEYLDLSACALGAGTHDALLERLCGTVDLAEPVVGEIMVGPR